MLYDKNIYKLCVCYICITLLYIYVLQYVHMLHSYDMYVHTIAMLHMSHLIYITHMYV